MDLALPGAAWLLSAGARPPTGLLELHSDVVAPVPLEAAFDFFADAWNLERITPPWLNFRIRTARPIEMRAGAVLDYRIRLRGVPIPWRTRIDVWEPGVRFVDRQLIGPYHWWRHEHRFVAVDGGTRVLDHVEYLPRVAWLSRGWVRADVERIFAYRREALVRELTRPSPGHQPVLYDAAARRGQEPGLRHDQGRADPPVANRRMTARHRC